MKLTIIGVGPGRPDLLTAQAKTAIEQASTVYCTGRLFDAFAFLNPNTLCLPFSDMVETLLKKSGEENLVLLASGDVGFYSVSSVLRRRLTDWHLEFMNGLSSLQYFCARLQVPYDDVITVSVHGREKSVVPYVSYAKRVFVLTGGSRCAHDVIEELVDAGLGAAGVFVGENLSAPEERILSGTAEELQGTLFDSLSVMLVENPSSVNPWQTLRDEDFIRGKTPMTKEDVRNISLARLNIQPADIVYDVGAGTGSVAVAMARRAFEGTVYAVEKEAEACGLILENRKRLGAFNLKAVCGKAPDALEELPAPDKVFIGGSSGQMDDIFRLALEKNPQARIVVNAITLETLYEAVQCFEKRGFAAEVSCVNSAKAEQVGRYHMMKAQNPVYIISGERHG